MQYKSVLWIPQLSMNNGTVMYPSRDGNCIILNTFLKYFATIPTVDWMVHLLLPPLDIIDKDDFKEFDRILGDTLKNCPNVHFSYFKSQSKLSPIQNRYYFDDSIPERLKMCHYDLIVNNIPEISRNIVAFYPPGYKGKLISCHWFPDYFFKNDLTGSWNNGNKISYSFRQLDGILSSDANIFICDSTMHGWQENILDTFRRGAAEKIFKNSPMLSLCMTDLTEYKEIRENMSVHFQPKYSVTTAIFPSRITASMYTNWHEAFKMFLFPDTVGRIIFCNPSGDKGIKCIEEHFPDVEFEDGEEQALFASGNKIDARSYNGGSIIVLRQPLTKQQYYEIAFYSHSVINLYFAERYGGIAIREVITIGQLLPFVPWIYEFKHWFKDITHGKFSALGWETLQTPRELASKYNSWMIHIEDHPEVASKINLNFSQYEHFAKDFEKFKKFITDLKII